MKFLKNLLPEIFGVDVSKTIGEDGLQPEEPWETVINKVPDKPTDPPPMPRVLVQPHIKKGEWWWVRFPSGPELTCLQVARYTSKIVQLREINTGILPGPKETLTTYKRRYPEFIERVPDAGI